MRGLRGKVAIVTGAAMGIGEATALRLAEEGAVVAVCDIQDADGTKVVGEIGAKGGRAKYYHLDVSNGADVQRTYEQIERDLGPIYGLVNNAGIAGVNAPTHLVEEGDWDRLIAVNLKGVFLCTKFALRSMLRQKSGSIVNVSSIYGLIGAADVPPYHASKGAIRLMAKNDAVMYASQGIRVNSIHPGFIDTPMVQKFAADTGDKAATYRALASLHPIGRLGKAEEIGAGITFLLSEDASFVTGAELVVDGGYTAK